MNKQLILFVLAFFAGLAAFARQPSMMKQSFWNAQVYDVQRVEGGVFGGLSVPLGDFHKSNKDVGGGFGLELRYNYPTLPLDFGVQLALTTAKYNGTAYDDYYVDGFKYDQSNRTYFVMALCDWNFRQGRMVNPFVGMGIGGGMNDTVGDDYYHVSRHATAVFMPRFGVELFHHVRFTLASHVSRKGFHNVQLNVGLTLGGRPKK